MTEKTVAETNEEIINEDTEEKMKIFLPVFTNGSSCGESMMFLSCAAGGIAS